MKIFLITVFFAVLVVSGYAYTYTTGTKTIEITEPAGNVVSVNATATQPNWDSVLDTVTDTFAYRPNASGDKTGIDDQFPATGAHWDKVDEVTADSDNTYVASNSPSWKDDLYHLPDHSTQTVGGDINDNTVYFISRATANITQESAYALIKTNSVEYTGTAENLTISYAAYSYQWTNNPQTGSPWTWSEIDALQAGLGIRQAASGIYSRTTQNYSEVSFDAPPLTSSTPTGDLFEITPDSDFSGDLQVRVYLMNTADVDKAYQSLEMRLYLESSVEAGESPNYQALTIENGVTTFNLVGISGGSYTLSVTGGSYTLTSRQISEWPAGYTVTPELYCQVTQR